MALILINGSPTSEFQFHCGLKQGDPLAHYLFILIMESLHLSFSRAVDAGIFTGIKVDSSLTIFHLFYADDAVFISKCSNVNLTGVMVGGNSSTIKAWDDTIGKLKARLSNWKLKTLSIGGRLTLLKSVLELFHGIQGDERKITWVKWSKGSVALSLRRTIRGRVEAHQLDLLQNLIGPAILTNLEDRWVWDLNGK
nr:RNA-directed DNA polymerase, eukaryota [Tanacetum cinerariifolium]